MPMVLPTIEMITDTMMLAEMATGCAVVEGVNGVRDGCGAGDGRGRLEGEARAGATPLDDVAMATLHEPPRAAAEGDDGSLTSPQVATFPELHQPQLRPREKHADAFGGRYPASSIAHVSKTKT